MNLKDFLAAKGEAYSRIDTTRMGRFWAENGALFAALPPVVHLVGTNGKGSTGRLLAQYLLTQGLPVGHYTSPHLLRFNERFWLNGADASDEALEQAHLQLCDRLSDGWLEALSYFEYATLLAARLFMNAGCQAVIWEAGLGGEFDATTVFPARLLLVTPIELDHQSFLGSSVEAIAATKLGAMRCETILARQPHPSTVQIAQMLGQTRGFRVFEAQTLAPDTNAFDKAGSPPYMAVNRQLAFAAARRLGFSPRVEDFLSTPLFGRLTQLKENIWLDVGHNAAAARAVANAFAEKQVTLVYNSYEDKDYKAILSILKPKLKRVLIFPVSGSRVVKTSDLIAAIEANGLTWDYFEKLEAKECYLVFGSFSVAEAFLKAGYAG